MNNLRRLLVQSIQYHRHLCPRKVLGVRMGLFAGKFWIFLYLNQKKLNEYLR